MCPRNNRRAKLHIIFISAIIDTLQKVKIYEYLTVFAAFLIILAPTAMVAVAMGVTLGFIEMGFGFIEMSLGIIEMSFGFASFASGSVEMTFDAVGVSFGGEVMAWGWLEVPVGLHVAIVEGEFHAFQRDGSAPGGGCDGDGVVAVAQGVGRHGHGILVLALCQSAAAVVERRVVCAGGSHGLAVEAQAEQRLAAGAEEDDDFARTDRVHVVAHVDGHIAPLSALERAAVACWGAARTAVCRPRASRSCCDPRASAGYPVRGAYEGAPCGIPVLRAPADSGRSHSG